jgi:hypothetical protein
MQGSGFRVQGFRGSVVQGFRGSGVQGFRGSGVRWFRVRWFRGSGMNVHELPPPPPARMRISALIPEAAHSTYREILPRHSVIPPRRSAQSPREHLNIFTPSVSEYTSRA